ncbi:MAG TPA: CheR family methyltransferase [Myxococcota bacterium]|nr:CheR family methyltransferase [Myxococcota bacterium]
MTAKRTRPERARRPANGPASASGSPAARGESKKRRSVVRQDRSRRSIPSTHPVPTVVGVGGSAGSLTPLRQLFGALPPDSGMAFVVVSHQAPTGKSLLPEILAKTTQMPVREIRGETPIEADRVYVVPRGHSVAAHEGALRIEPIGEMPLPIDHFFRTLAHDRGRHAAGIVLSGTGSDGTLGLAAIRAESGLSLAQAPETAEFDSMPRSAIAARATDFVLPVGEMPARLAAHARTADVRGRGRGHGGSPRVTSSELDRILALIRQRGGHDFSAYKRDTLLRRIERRMDLLRLERLSDYARFLQEHDDEIDALWRDWLIGVSGFFRDPAAFEALAESGLPPLLSARPRDRPVRVWVPGCATGEEAYSIAIVVLEALEASGQSPEIQVFATDLDPAAIQTARAGRYPKTIAAAVGARRLDRYFVEEEHKYRVKKKLRDRIVFAVQDALRDPPFTRVDLISCRNVLIYVVPSAQQELLSVFHYSLNPGGLLLLGASEHLGASAGHFSVLDKRWKLVRRHDSSAPTAALRWAPRTSAPAGPSGGRPLPERPKFDLTETLRTCLAERFGPPAVVVDLRGQIQQTHGRVSPYLELAPGRANLNVVDMAQEALRAPLVSALREILRAGATTVEKEVRWRAEGKWRALRLSVGRIEGRRLPSPLLLVSFEPISGRTKSRAFIPSTKGRRSPRTELEGELQRVRHDLEVSISELQAANEELASANEEVESANEELQSSNEELQTSKEETQSLNEELQTVNAELTEKVRGLAEANDDLLNLMSNIEIATIFLDDRLRVKRFTPQARSVARLIDGDVGRPLADLATLVDYPDLLADAGDVLESLQSVEKQALGSGGAWYTVRIRPYRTARNAVEGLVVTFIDITEAKRTERIAAARSLAESIVDAVREPLLVLDASLQVVRANRSFYRVFGVESEETEGLPVDELGSRQWNIPRLRGLLQTTLRDGLPFEDFEVVHEFPRIGRRRMVLSGRPVSMPGDETPVLLVLGIQDAGAAPTSRAEAPRT